MASLKNKKTNSEVLKWIIGKSKRYLPIVGIITVFSAIISLTGVALALLSKEIIDIATKQSKGSFLFYGILLFAVIIIQIILYITDFLLKAVSKGKLTIALRSALFTAISRRKYSEISEYHSGDLLNRLTSDAEVVVNAVVDILPSVASMLTKIVGGVVALVMLDKRISFIILVFGLVVPASGRIISRKFKSLHKECQRTEGTTRAFMQECFENVVVLKAFEGEAPFTKKLHKYLNEHYRLVIKRSRMSVIINMGLYTFFTLGYYAILLWGAGQIAGGAITYGTLMAFLQLFQQLRAPLQNVSGILPHYYSALASAERLIEIENGTMDESADKERLEEVKGEFSGIEINNVTFAYKDEIILRGLTQSIEKGKITAITGESGSGKSTIFKILLGLYVPQEGSITVNGDLPLNTDLRGIFAYVPQGNMILSGTVRENITLGNENVSEEELIAVTKTAEIYDIIKELPNGFDTELSERGAGLSEGQLQRISIARALLTNAPVLLLDEATSALDEATETRVLNNIKEMRDKTILFVTHRNTSLKVCDSIIRIEKEYF